MTMKRFAKLSFSFALAAVCLVGYLALGSQTVDAAVSCPSVMCSGNYTVTSTSCNYFDPSTNCTFRCKQGVKQGPGPFSLYCTTDCNWDYPL